MLQRTVRLQGVVSLNRVLLDLIEYSSSFTGFFYVLYLDLARFYCVFTWFYRASTVTHLIWFHIYLDLGDCTGFLPSCS